MSVVTKLRSYRIGPFAIFDFASAYLGSWYVAPYLSKWLTRTQVMWLAVPAGVVAHIVVGVETPLNKMVVGPRSNILAQAAIGLMLYKGLFNPGSWK